MCIHGVRILCTLWSYIRIKRTVYFCRICSGVFINVLIGSIVKEKKNPFLVFRIPIPHDQPHSWYTISVMFIEINIIQSATAAERWNTIRHAGGTVTTRHFDVVVYKHNIILLLCVYYISRSLDGDRKSKQSENAHEVLRPRWRIIRKFRNK